MDNLTNLFPTLESTKFPTPIYVGNGKLENSRLIVSIKLDSSIKPFIKADQISFTCFKMKKVSKFNHTHSVVVNQNEAPANAQVSHNFLTLGTGSENAIDFTLTISQLKGLAYNVEGKGQFIKLEIVDNGMQVAIFRYLKDVPKEVTGFKAASRMTVGQTPNITAQTAVAEGNKVVSDFFNDL